MRRTARAFRPALLWPALLLLLPRPPSARESALPALEPPAGAPVQISEIMSTPIPGGAGGAGEWVELHNTGTDGVDLSGWELGDEHDPHDRLIPLTPGGTTVMPGGGYALVLDPSTPDPGPTTGWALQTVMLRPEDGSIGNGLKGEADRVILTGPDGDRVDSVSWSRPWEPGRSWERADPPFSTPSPWRVCRAGKGSTPGAPNSWTPVSGDRAIRWIPPEAAFRAGSPLSVRAVLRDEGGSGLNGVWVQASAEGVGMEGGAAGGGAGKEEEAVYLLGIRQAFVTAPFDSMLLAWTWAPPDGGWWRLRVRITAPARERAWGDRDSLLVAASWAERVRVVSEALPRPEIGRGEWLELWGPAFGPDADTAAPGSRKSWAGWTVRISGSAGSGTWTRSMELPGSTAPVLLITADGLPPPGSPFTVSNTPAVHWPGLRLSDAGSRVVLADPTGAVVDSAVLRPVPGLPRGHSLQRYDPGLPGWWPSAWRISLRPEDNTPGRPPDPAPQFPAGSPRPDGLDLRCIRGRGEVTFVWRSPASRLWMEARLYDLSGRLAARPIPRSLQPGEWALTWRPRERDRVLQPGIYILIVEAEADGGGGRWRIRRPLGVRP